MSKFKPGDILVCLDSSNIPPAILDKGDLVQVYLGDHGSLCIRNAKMAAVFSNDAGLRIEIAKFELSKIVETELWRALS